jgi:branched-chain amino acid transport system permease protein
MDVSALVVQALNGLASASSLFLVAAGLSLIFGVSRIVNFAHGSFFMLGVYVAYSLVEHLAPTWALELGRGGAYWACLLLAALAVGLLGGLVEVLLLRRIYQAPELFQLLATFALVLILKDAVLALWGAEDLLGPRAPGLEGAVSVFGRWVPAWDLALIALGPLMWLALWALLTHTRFGVWVRAATQDRDMLAALGVNPQTVFTAVFTLGCALAGLAGALQLPREPASLGLDMSTLGDAFVVVVVGGMGSISGAFIAALLIAQTKALCIAIGTVTLGDVTWSVSKFTLVAEFVVMALVLLWRPWGLMGRPIEASRHVAQAVPLPRATAVTRTLDVYVVLMCASLPWLLGEDSYGLVLGTELCLAVLFAASLHVIMGPGGLHSFGHAAWFGLGAYAAALLSTQAQLPLLSAVAWAVCVCAVVAWPLAWVTVRLSGVYLAMLTLAFAQIVWSVCFQWDDVTGGSNGLTGIWPSAPWDGRAPFYALCLGLTVLVLAALRGVLHSPFGFALRAQRDAPLRAEALGISGAQVQSLAFVLSASVAGLAGALFAFSKGSIAPDVMGISRSVDALVMVLLGGLHSLAGPVVGAVTFTALQDVLARNTDYWRAVLGVCLLLIVLLFPQGIAGGLRLWWDRWFSPRGQA